jgi:NAD(P)-dependent dehydrogenase (short-subunit alcohol dehydrogenase family)
MTQDAKRRIVIVGASSGIGRSLGLGLAGRGDAVALLARRTDRIEAAAAEAGADATAVPCDVTDEDSCRRAIDTAAERLGGIDGMVYCAGIGKLSHLSQTDAATWRAVFDTNVTGAALTTAAALPHLAASGGVAAYLSSVSASLTAPWPGLGAYAVSKAALDKLVEALRGEHPEVRFTRVVVGDTTGGEGHSATEFATGWDPDLFTSSVTAWFARGFMSGGLIDIGDLVDIVHLVLGTPAAIPSITITPRPPV